MKEKMYRVSKVNILQSRKKKKRDEPRWIVDSQNNLIIPLCGFGTAQPDAIFSELASNIWDHFAHIEAFSGPVIPLKRKKKARRKKWQTMHTKRYFVSRCQMIPSTAMLVTVPKSISAVHTNPERGQTWPFPVFAKYPVLPSHRSKGNDFASEKARYVILTWHTCAVDHVASRCSKSHLSCSTVSMDTTESGGSIKSAWVTKLDSGPLPTVIVGTISPSTVRKRERWESGYKRNQ